MAHFMAQTADMLRGGGDWHFIFYTTWFLSKCIFTTRLL